jgi:broad specificity phosphatase PhoE
MKLYIVRHGQSNFNVQRKINFLPSKDCYLTELGMQQAYATKEELKDKTWDAVIVSELFRTQQTAAIINEDKQIPMFIEDKINEINTGIEGQDYDEYHAQLEEKDDIKRRTISLPNGESYAQLKERVRQFLKELKNKNFSSVLIVSHFVTIIALRQLIENQSDEDSVQFKPGNAEIFEAELKKSF